MEHPIFLPTSGLLSRAHSASGVSAKSEIADAWANVPGGRVRRGSRATLAHSRPQGERGDKEMAKKGAKKKAAKKR
jgi:hypothetical protein